MLKSTGLQNSHKQTLNWNPLVKLREGKKSKATAQNLKLEYVQIVPDVRVQQCIDENNLHWEEQDNFVPIHLYIKGWEKLTFEIKVFPSLFWWLNWRKTNITQFKYKTTITRGSQPRAKGKCKTNTWKLQVALVPARPGRWVHTSQWCVSHHCPLWAWQNGSPQSQHLPCAGGQSKTSGFLGSTKREQTPELLGSLLPKNTELPKAPAFPPKLIIRNGWSSFAWTVPETLL